MEMRGQASGVIVMCCNLLAMPLHAQEAIKVPAQNGAQGDVTLDAVEVSAPTSEIPAKDASLGALGDIKLIDAPYSVNVITRELLENQQAAHYGDYLKNDPSVTIGNVPVGFANIRGFSLGVGGYEYDGLGGHLGLSDGRYQLEGFERIEILKGPSAFLNGLLSTSASVGGSLNFVPKKPTDSPVRAIDLGYTTQSLFSVAADVGDRFGADRQFGYRLNVGYKDGEQAVDNADWTHKAVALALDWKVTHDLVLSLGLEHAENHYPSLQPFFILTPGAPVPDAPDAKRSIAQPWDDFKVKADTVYLRADWNIVDDWSMTLQGMRTTDDRGNVKEARFGSIDNAAGDATLFESQEQSEQTQDSAQVLLHGKVMTAGIENKLTVGVTASNLETKDSFVPLGIAPTNIYNPVASPEPASTGLPAPVLSQKNRSTGYLVSDIAKFSEHWSVLVGARYAKFDVDNYDSTGSFVESSNRVSKTSPTGALMFKPAQNSLLYLSYAEGLEQGGQAGTTAVNANQFLPPVVTKQLEFGGKLELDGATLAAAAFDLKRPFEFTNASNVFVQQGEQEHRGIEASVIGRVTRDLMLVAGVMFLDPEINGTGDPASDGKRPPGVPQFQANVWADYRLPMFDGIFVNGGAYHSGSQYADSANTQELPEWTRFDVGARYETKIDSKRLVIRASVENVTDKDYWASAVGGILTLAEPRTYKLSAHMDF
ncbi:MAG TPA: TonB-dependent siderophore receptor [Burkholderiales bacterium]|nr:TonB-dependent siderophore receptor [Burkholderiales bacterium]